MAELPDFDAMTLDEIDAWNVAKKAELLAKQAEYRSSNEARHRKVYEWHVNEAISQLTKAAERDGRTLVAQAWYWLVEENAVDPGHRIQAGLYLKSIGAQDDRPA